MKHFSMILNWTLMSKKFFIDLHLHWLLLKWGNSFSMHKAGYCNYNLHKNNTWWYMVQIAYLILHILYSVTSDKSFAYLGEVSSFWEHIQMGQFLYIIISSKRGMYESITNHTNYTKHIAIHSTVKVLGK